MICNHGALIAKVPKKINLEAFQSGLGGGRTLTEYG